MLLLQALLALLLLFHSAVGDRCDCESETCTGDADACDCRDMFLMDDGSGIMRTIKCGVARNMIIEAEGDTKSKQTWDKTARSTILCRVGRSCDIDASDDSSALGHASALAVSSADWPALNGPNDARTYPTDWTGTSDPGWTIGASLSLSLSDSSLSRIRFNIYI